MKIVRKFLEKTKRVKYKTEVFSGVTVALALVPSAIAYAMIAGFSPLTGLYTAFVMGLLSALLGGKPGMISGAAGAIAVIYLGLITELRLAFPAITNEAILQYVFATAIVAGILQLIVGVFKLGKFMRLVPQPVMFGFVNGLAIIIFMSQLPFFTAIFTAHPELTQYVDSIIASGPAVTNMAGLYAGGKELATTVGLVVLTMLIIWRLPRYTKAVPSSLAAVIIVSVLVLVCNVSTTTVADILQDGASIKGVFPPLTIPQIPVTWQTITIVFPYACIVAAVGLIESLLTLNFVEEITESRGDSNQECIAQGVANVASGFLSGMGGCAVVGLTLVNISAGSRARLAGIIASCLLLVFIMFGSTAIEKLPMAGLIGLMFMAAIGTFEWSSLKIINKMPKSDVVVMVLVTVITPITHNLAIAVLIGVILSALAYSWQNAVRIQARKWIDENGNKHYEIRGPLFFGSVRGFLEKFDELADPEEVIIDFKESRIADMSAIEAVNSLTQRYRKVGKVVHLRHLSEDCKILLQNADAIIDVNIMEDPTYKIPANNTDLLIRN